MKTTLTHALLVGCGGFLGSVLRYALSGTLQRLFPLSAFPLGTLCVNLLGCLLIGAVGGLADSRQLFSAGARAFTAIGVLGGFTTFSAFGYESFALLRGDQHLYAAAHAGLHVALGIACVWAGYAAASTS